jgi:formylglycine-generating enzyme required for sulfatase activity
MPGANFPRSCDYCSCGSVEPQQYPATVGSFSLDAYEVTVGRMHRFLAAYDNGWRPEPGEGKNPRDDEDNGWDADWGASLPSTALELSDALGSSSCPYATWTPLPNENATLPINCVSWFVAQAFCVWDNGRLPTEAEWNYAAGNGSQERFYPWSDPHDSQTLSDEYAVYAVDGNIVGPESVGTKPKGRGYFGQYDLAGNVAEWTLDAFQICYLTPDACNNCGASVSDDGQRTYRGGHFGSSPDELAVSARNSYIDTDSPPIIGFRCARDL